MKILLWSLLLFMTSCKFNYKITKLDVPNIKIENKQVMWEKVKEATLYKVKINEKESTTKELYFDLSNLDFGEYIIKVKAVNKKLESNYSKIINYKILAKLDKPKNLKIENNILLIDKKESEIADVFINDTLITSTINNKIPLKNLKNEDIVSVILKQEGYESSDKTSVTYYSLEIPKNISITNDVLSFEKVSNALSYKIYINDEFLEEIEKTNYLLKLSLPGNYKIGIIAINKTSASKMAIFNYKISENIKNLSCPLVKLKSGNLSWDHVKDAVSYKISINNENYIDIGYVNTFNSSLIKSGSNVIKLIAVSYNPLYNSPEFIGEFVKLEAPENLFLNDQNLSWYGVNNASNYKVVLTYNDNSKEVITPYTALYLEDFNITNIKILASSPGFLNSDYQTNFERQNTDNPDFYKGIGTRKRPFVVSSYIHLLNMNKYLNQNKYFELKNDIDLNSIEWVPFDQDFNGFFDGKNFKIYNFFMKNNQKTSYFIKSSSGNIKNLGIEYNILNNQDNIEIGGILLTNNGVLENCHLNLKVIINSVKNLKIGGLVISNLSLGTIINSSYDLNLEVKEYKNIESLNVAGVANNNEGFITNIKGNLEYIDEFSNLSGDIFISQGVNFNLGSLENFSLDGNIDLKGSIDNNIDIIYAGVVNNNLSKVNNCKLATDVNIAVTENEYFENIYIYGISKEGKIYNCSCKSDIYVSGSNVYVFGIGGDEITSSNYYGTITANAFNEELEIGGIARSPLSVNNCSAEANMILNGTNIMAGGIVIENNKMGFSYFIGEITVKSKNSNVLGGLSSINNGLIEYCDSTVKIVSKNSTIEKSGGITGLNYGHIKDSNSVINIDASGEKLYLGGLTGENNKENNVIDKSYASINIKADGIICYLGGLVGNNLNGVIKCSYSIGVLSAPFKTLYSKTGGLVGFNDTISVIKNCYSIVNIESSFYSGGFIGHNKGYVSYSFSTGRVEANAFAGGFIGYNEGVIVDSFYDTEKSNQNDLEKGIALTTEQMVTPNIFSTFPKFISFEDLSINPDNVWVFIEGKLPKLYFQ